MQSRLKYTLSICIPSYNRSDTLEYLLNNIVSQLNQANLWNKVQICVSDNASTDDTSEMIERFKQKYPIIYSRHSENLGADRNFLNAVAIASGDYCWLFGSDDRFEEGAINKVVEFIEQNPTCAGISVNCQGYDFTFSKKIRHSYPIQTDQYFDNVADAYHKLGSYFGYLSGNIIKRKYWNEVLIKYDVSDYYRAYVHVYIVSQMIKQHNNWVYLGDKLVGWRSDNDSFLERTKEGFVKRMRVDYEYIRIAKDVFGKNSAIAKSQINLICVEHIFSHLIALKIANKINIWSYFKEIYQVFGSASGFYYKLLPVFLAPRFLLVGFRSLIHFFRKLKSRS